MVVVIVRFLCGGEPKLSPTAPRLPLGAAARGRPPQTGGRFIWQDVGCALTYESHTTSERKP